MKISRPPENPETPETLPAGSHLGERVTCNGQPIMRKAQTIYASEVAR